MTAVTTVPAARAATAAHKTTAYSVVEPSRRSKRIAAVLVIVYALVSMIPLFWIFITGFKTPPDSIAYPPKIIFSPSLEGYVNLFTTRTRQTPSRTGTRSPLSSASSIIGAIGTSSSGRRLESLRG